VNDNIKVPLKQNEFDALVSLSYNIGPEAFKNSTLVKRINNKEPLENILKEISNWKKPIDVITRRAKEIRLYRDADYSNSLALSTMKYFS
jgi:lysozyme